MTRKKRIKNLKRLRRRIRGLVALQFYSGPTQPYQKSFARYLDKLRKSAVRKPLTNIATLRMAKAKTGA